MVTENAACAFHYGMPVSTCPSCLAAQGKAQPASAARESENEAPKRGKMLGRLGWHGQCACCCGQDTKRQEKAREKRRWRR